MLKGAEKDKNKVRDRGREALGVQVLVVVLRVLSKNTSMGKGMDKNERGMA